MNWQALSASLVAVFLWAVGPAVVKASIAGLPDSYFLVLRFLFSAAVLAPALGSLVKGHKRVRAADWAQLIFLTGLHYQTQLVAVKFLPISWYMVFFATTPALTLLFMGIDWNRRQIGGLFLATVGSLAFVTGAFDGMSWWGLAALFASVGGWIGLTLVLRKQDSGLTNWETTAVCNLAALGAALFYWLGSGCPTAPLQWAHGEAILLMGLGMPAAFFLYTYSLRKIPTVAVVNQFLEPVFGVLIGLFFFSEVMSSAQWLGAGLIVVSSTYFALSQNDAATH